MTDGLEVFVQLVIAAITTHPFSSVAAGLAATAVDARPLTGPPSLARPPSASGIGFCPLPQGAGENAPDLGWRARASRPLGPPPPAAPPPHAPPRTPPL